MLEICDIHKIYSKGTAQETVVLQGASFSFQDGVFYAIIGKSGCGKTTLLHILGGLDVPDQGKVPGTSDFTPKKDGFYFPVLQFTTRAYCMGEYCDALYS